jgi:hypothetical protein
LAFLGQDNRRLIDWLSWSGSEKIDSFAFLGYYFRRMIGWLFLVMIKEDCLIFLG